MNTGDPDRRSLLVIAGATGVGKTDLALHIASQLPSVILGADSIQVYKRFDIGSAKPSPEQRRTVPHVLVDVLEPAERWDANRYAQQADIHIRRAHADGALPVVVGGSGLWIRALLRGLLDLPPVDPALRQEIQTRAERFPQQTLQHLQQVDPISAERIHPHDTLRVVRALEVYEQTGQPLGRLRKAHALGELRYRSLFVHLVKPSDELRPQLHRRVERMLKLGWLEETRAIIADHGPHIPPLRSVGYRQLCDFLSGACSWDDTSEGLKRATWTYAKQQRNWMRTEPSVNFEAHPEQDRTAIMERVWTWLQG